MVSDIFTFMDCFMGGFSVLELGMWTVSVVWPIYSVLMGTFWYGNCWVESMLFEGAIGFSSSFPIGAKKFGGLVHLNFSLLYFLLAVNLAGVLAYSYPVNCHYALTLGFSFPFWFATVFLNFNKNWWMFFISHVEGDMGIAVVAMLVASQWFSLLVRPFTLSMRMSTNLFMGKLLVNLTFYMAEEFIFPFVDFWGLASILLFFMGTGLYVIEGCLASLQSMIFVGLLSFYCEEAQFKL
uniref:ATP synthase subunit a n=1 Tax=Calyptogena rectimargo TaxID=1298638 RepID=A0A8K1W5C5_9BIVA|nr:ATP synthase F0 subunit 6 [Calyptogena rectimargo]